VLALGGRAAKLTQFKGKRVENAWRYVQAA